MGGFCWEVYCWLSGIFGGMLWWLMLVDVSEDYEVDVVVWRWGFVGGGLIFFVL